MNLLKFGIGVTLICFFFSCEKKQELNKKEKAKTNVVQIFKKELINIEFKLLMGFDLPLADQSFAEAEDLIALKESLPKEVKELNKREVSIKGFMEPLHLNKQGLIDVFLFAPDQSSCCFGKTPDLNGYIYCTSAKGLPNLKDILLELRGDFTSKPTYNTEEELIYLYTMKVKSVKELSLKIPLGPSFDF